MNEMNVESAVRDVLRKMRASSAMNLQLATALIEEVEAEAARMGVKAVVAVSDASGRPVAIHCMDGSYIGSFDVALNKTYTSVAFQMSTAELAVLAAPGGSLYGIQNTNEGKIVIFGGGEPLLLDGVMIGAIGVSGGTAEQDTRLGAYGKNKLKEVIAWK
ncbi:MAG: heme-binding protein [Candidatus Gastranaerophilales bacterium]|nr:heme-binding protein [Candidatus Gastranaerophilales bacterium]